MWLWAVTLLVTQFAPAQSFYAGTSVIQLDDSNYKQVTKGETLWFVEFYREGCPHCVNAKSAYIKAAKNMKGYVKFGAVDVTKAGSVAGRLGIQIQGVPSFKVMRPSFSKKTGKTRMSTVDYNGARKAKPMVDFAKSNMPQFFYNKGKALTLAKLADFYNNSELPKFVLVNDKLSVSILMKSLTSEFYARGSFAYATSHKKKGPELIKKVKAAAEGVTLPTVVYLKDAEGADMEVYTGKKKLKNIQEWIKERALPKRSKEFEKSLRDKAKTAGKKGRKRKEEL